MTDQTTLSQATTVETSAQPAIVVNFDNKLDYKGAKFNFREVKDAETGVKTKRATIELAKLPVPSVEGVVAILQAGGKPLELLLEAVQDVVISRARDVINDNPHMTAETFDYSQVDWNAIANLEKEDRRSGIAKEVWEDFATNYAEIMPSVSGVTKEQAAKAASIFIGKFASIKNRKDLIEKLVVRLAIYAENSPRAGEFAECLEVLDKRATKLLAAEDEKLEDNLGL